MGGAAADLSTANLARIAVAITNQPWDKLGLDGHDDALLAPGGGPTTTDAAAALLQLRGTAILMTRLAAMTAPPHVYANLATSTIGKTILADFIEPEATVTTSSSSSLSVAESKRGAVDSKNKTKKYSWPGMDNSNVVVQQVHRFVGRMIQGYKQVPYHNQEHAFHVLQSITKLIDLMITGGGKTFGLKHDPLALFALVFAALIHDVEHQGIPVRCYYGHNV
jgi:3'5'-cyclic nucleotide phosphodiesterase